MVVKLLSCLNTVRPAAPNAATFQGVWRGGVKVEYLKPSKRPSSLKNVSLSFFLLGLYISSYNKKGFMGVEDFRAVFGPQSV